MDPLAIQHVIWAVSLGAISAVSLPLGSLFGLQTNPAPRLISVMAAFGAGALIAALSVELVAPTLFELEKHGEGAQGGEAYASFLALVAGAASGGLVFTLLDRLLSLRGGFLRRTSGIVSYLTSRQRDRDLAMLEELAAFPLLKDLPPAHVNSLVHLIRPVTYEAGDIIGREGEPADDLTFIVSGAVEAFRLDGVQAEFGPGSVIGVIPLVLDRPHVATGEVTEAVAGYVLSRQDLVTLRDLSPEFDAAIHALTQERLELIEQLTAERDRRAVTWLREAGQSLRTGNQMPDELNLRRVVEEYKGAPLAIWLGILLDGIPESFVIGAGLLVILQSKAAGSVGFADVVPYTLIAGLFLSNFPEALASSANMRLQGFGKQRIFLLWFSLLVITALGAGVGFLLAGSLNHTWVVFAEGLAAGAMLTMIAAAMIPEAVHMGTANAVGLATLAGFLAAISFKLLG